MRLIGLTGPAGCGKDTVAGHLVAKHGYIKLSFAEPIKDALCAMFGWAPDRLLDREWKETVLPLYGKSPRQLMQTLGTEWGRNLIHPELWMLILQERIVALEQSCVFRGAVISDVRFENEASMIREQGGDLWHIKRAVASVHEHISEAGVDINPLCDVQLNNSSTVDSLFLDVDRVIFRGSYA